MTIGSVDLAADSADPERDAGRGDRRSPVDPERSRSPRAWPRPPSASSRRRRGGGRWGGTFVGGDWTTPTGHSGQWRAVGRRWLRWRARSHGAAARRAAGWRGEGAAPGRGAADRVRRRHRSRTSSARRRSSTARPTCGVGRRHRVSTARVSPSTSSANLGVQLPRTSEKQATVGTPVDILADAATGRPGLLRRFRRNGELSGPRRDLRRKRGHDRCPP